MPCENKGATTIKLYPKSNILFYRPNFKIIYNQN